MYKPAEIEFCHRFNYFIGMTYKESMNLVIWEGFDGCHILDPIFENSPDAVYSLGSFMPLQLKWAKEQGLATSDPKEIVLAQIEAHRTEVLYSLDPITYNSNFLKRLPGCVKKTLCWQAADSRGHDFGAYNLRLSNFPTINLSWQAEGHRAFYFSPSIDPTVGLLPAPSERSTDVCFVGSITRHHTERIEFLDQLLLLSDQYNVRFHLLRSKVTKLASLPILRYLPGNRWGIPARLHQSALEPLFGREMFDAMKFSKLVINLALDDIGRPYRGNMRCFEALSCGAALLTDEGTYPSGFVPDVTILDFSTPLDAETKIRRILADGSWQSIGTAGQELLRTRYTKTAQWANFVELTSTI